MVLKLYGQSQSTCTRRVATVLKEKNIPYELVHVDWKAGEHKTPAFRAIQPFGQVPYIVDDDGFTLYESRAICRYLATRYRGQGAELVPPADDVRSNALFEQAASIEGWNFDPYAYGIAVEKAFRPFFGLDTDEAILERHTTTLDAKLDGYEAILSKQKYLAGDEVTLADLFHLSYGAMITDLGYNYLVDEVKRPNVARWWKDITSRPSWQAVKDGA